VASPHLAPISRLAAVPLWPGPLLEDRSHLRNSCANGNSHLGLQFGPLRRWGRYRKRR
jgi:hypothetical protein